MDVILILNKCFIRLEKLGLLDVKMVSILETCVLVYR